MVMVVKIVIMTMMIVRKEDLTFKHVCFKVLWHLKSTSGIVESMKTTVERMTTAIDVNAYS